MIKHALIQLKPVSSLGIHSDSTLYNKIMIYNGLITVRKGTEDDSSILYWKTGRTGIPIRWIKEVIEGDISEFLL